MNDFTNKWVYIGVCHRTFNPGEHLTEDEKLEITALNISTKHYNTKNEMIDAVIKRLLENKDE